MDEGVSPTLRQWQLAEALQGYRDRASMTLDQAAAKLREVGKRWSKSKIHRIETRSYAPKPSEVEQFAEVYGLSKQETEELVRMSHEAREKGWWQSSAMPKTFHTMAGLERDAKEIRQWEIALIPGLMQTSDYARAVIESIEPSTPPDVVDSLVAARTTRGRVITRKSPPKVHVILCEMALRCPVGGRKVMRGQLEKIIELTNERNILVQVAPIAGGVNPGLEGGFSILSLPQLSSDIGYADGVMGPVYLESQDDVRRCTMRFAALATLALSPKKSTELVRTILTEYQLSERGRGMTALDLSRATWRKSSRSGANSGGGQCVEVIALTSRPWRRSNRTGGANGSGGNCVEVVGLRGDRVAVRDNKNP
ncbi:MAG TPA: Scr1 family TA system antitoxin-like transcriptional regulator [Stackebrandtia sp.]|uniref:Scr1 family TA system antitoxin-like transcriptional regulator n=1 Tax=Stackebrandtia sp. TaxID=2023065 RepID=UPI002D748AC9|nr:Scr1 family TA system antitoxin-like transcriptional regulator [Stackebrandtia sp.]HZE40486.1 Scr1 family TA system antitoxin-like transcriptional regulator [Stackebrandtia sp.]